LPFILALLVALSAAAFPCAATAAAPGIATLRIGTAGAMGNYHPVGAVLCRIVNASRQEHGMRCTLATSDGSVANIDGVLSGRFDVGFAQSDTQFFALNGLGPYKGRPQPNLRALFTVYTEVFTLVVRQDSGIRAFADLRGKRVSVGTRGSGTRATMDLLMQAFGIAPADFGRMFELPFLDMVPALCDDRIDAFVFVGGHPNAIVSDAATSCPTRVVAVAGPEVDALVAAHPFFVAADVPGGMYPGTASAQPSLGVAATLVTRAALPDATAYAFVKAIFENFDDFRKRHPALAQATKEAAMAGDTAPVHPGALRYFKEVGLE
jgi:hypothetical protein